MAQRLKIARERAGHKTAADGARALKVPYPTYAGHENTGRGLRLPVATKYAKFFKVKLYWLLTGEGPMELEPQESARADLPPEDEQKVVEYAELLKQKRKSS